MNKFIISTLILLAAATTQINAIFVRGAIYKNEKTGQIIVILADYHVPSDATEEQHYQFISEIKKLKGSNVTIVEDTNNTTAHKDNKIYQDAVKYLDSLESASCPLDKIESDLTEKKLDVKNVECRIINGILCRGTNFLKLYEKQKSELTGIDAFKFSLYKNYFDMLPKKLNNLLLKEIKDNVTILEKQIEQIIKCKKAYSEENYTKILGYLKKTLKEFPKEEEYIKHIELAKTVAPISLLEPSTGAPLNKISRIMGSLIDSKIIYEILRNNKKKTIVICAGISHTSKVENFIKTIGYKTLNKDKGMKCFPPEICNETNTATEIYLDEKPTAINVRKLFEQI